MKIIVERHFSDGERAYDFMWNLRMHGISARLSFESAKKFVVRCKIEEELMGYDLLEDTSS